MNLHVKGKKLSDILALTRFNESFMSIHARIYNTLYEGDKTGLEVR